MKTLKALALLALFFILPVVLHAQTVNFQAVPNPNFNSIVPAADAGQTVCTFKSQGSNIILECPNAGVGFTAGGDLSGTSISQNVIGINGTNLAGLATGFLFNTTVTGIPSTIGSTGTGNVVRVTSATLVTPALGTPTALVLTNATGLPNAGLLNSVTTVNSQTCTLGSTCTVTAAPTGAAGGALTGTYPNPGLSGVYPTGALSDRTLNTRFADVFNALDNGAIGTNTTTAIGTTYGSSLSAFAAYTNPVGATPFSWATNPLYGLTFTMATSTNQSTTSTPLTFLESITDSWTASIALWQDPSNGNYLVEPGMLVSGSCIAANTTISSIDRVPGDANYGKITLSQNTSTTCASATNITFTISPTQLEALTYDWLGIQTAVAQADAANSSTGGEVFVPAGQYVLNHPVLNATGVAQGIKFAGGGIAGTTISFSSDLGTDTCGIGEAVRSTGGSSSRYSDFAVLAPQQSLTMGTAPNGMDGLCIGNNAKVDHIKAEYFHAGVNGQGNHWDVDVSKLSNNGYAVYFSPYSHGGVGNQGFSDDDFTGNTIASFATSTTNTMDSMTLRNVHTGFGPYGFYQEVKPSTVSSPSSFLTNSTLNNVFMESLGNAWIYGPNDFYGIVDNNTIIGGGFADVGGHSSYKISANAVPGVVDAAQFNNNVMIETNWSSYANITTAIVSGDGQCLYNQWINDSNFILDATASVPVMSCGQGAQQNTFTTPFGQGTFFATFSNLSTAFLPLTDLGGGTAQSYTTGTPFAGLASAPAASSTYVPVITYATTIGSAVKSSSTDVYTQGQLIYPKTGGITVTPNGMGAIGTTSGASSGSSSTASIRLDPMIGAAQGGGSAAVSCSQLPALTGDATTSAGSCGTTVVKINGTSLAGLATGILKNTTTSGVPSIAVVGTDYQAPPSMIAGAMGLYIPFQQGTTSSTSLTDYSGNSRNGTFGSSTAAPTWQSTGAGIVFSGGQYITIPQAALNGAETVMLWFAPTNPQEQDATNGLVVFVSDQNGNYFNQYASANGQMATGKSGSSNMIPTNRWAGNSSVAATFPASGTSAMYINGRPVSAYLKNSLQTTWTSSGTGQLGCDGSSFCASMIFYGMATYSTVLTPAQILANDQAFKAIIQAGAGVNFNEVSTPNFYLFDGDSRWWNAGSNESLLSSLPYLYAQAAPITDPFYNITVFGQTQATINTNQAANEFPLADGVTAGQRVFLDEGGYNDINSGTAAATILTSLETWCSNIHTRYPGSIAVISTVNPSSGLSATNEGHRETLNTSILSAWRGGTLGCDGLIDEAADPTASTQAVPNTFNPSGSGSYNATYYADGTHYLPALTSLMQSRGAAGILSAKGLLQKPYWVSIVIGFKDVSAAGLANTSIAIPLWNLGPTQRVCGITGHTTAGFTGITTPTVEVGDTNGSATTYVASTAISSTGFLAPYVSVANPTNTQVYATFGGANAMSNASAGSITIDVCVTTAP